jgi:dTDP-4-amino-4,6-dideoxy-D-galactose acyltransferase
MSIIFTGFEIRELEWDTKYFGMKCARVRLNKELNQVQFIELKKTINQYEFVTIDNDSKYMKNNELLCSIDGAHLVDVPLTFSHALLDLDYKEFDKVCTVMNNVEQNKKIESIAKYSFLPGRFYNDSRIDQGKADGLYACWIKNSFFREDNYFVLDDNNNGFILFSKINEDAGIDIELIAVDDKERNKGIAGKMIDSLKYYAIKGNIKYIDVVTQAHNVGAVNLYTRHGFKLKKCEYTYHFWNK